MCIHNVCTYNTPAASLFRFGGGGHIWELLLMMTKHGLCSVTCVSVCVRAIMCTSQCGCESK